MTQETENPSAPGQPAQGKRQTPIELYLQEIARNPKLRDMTMAGRSFIIGGVRPQKEPED
jgi:hypothetical protein